MADKENGEQKAREMNVPANVKATKKMIAESGLDPAPFGKAVAGKIDAK
ncbi:MAG: hypothetical protein AAF764_04025 [Pseudomonadota bacterium]